MEQKPKVIKTDQEARDKLKKGIDTVADIVKSTLGNGGRNVVYEYVPNMIKISNDGVSIAEQIFLEDETENSGANIIKQAALRTNKEVGDGTSTATLLTQAILNKGFEMIEESSTIIDSLSPIEIKRKLDKDVEPILEALDKRSKKIETDKEREMVAMTSVEDEKLAKIISELLGKVGSETHINLEHIEVDEVRYTITEGVKYNRGWFAPFMMNNNRAECILKDPYVLLTDQEINDPKDITEFVKKANMEGKPLVIVADNFSEAVIGQIALLKQKNNYPVLAIECQKVEKEERLKDIAVITDATVIEKGKDMKVANQSTDVMGQSKLVRADKSITHFGGGYSDKKRIKARLEEYQVGLNNAIEKNQKNIKKSLERKMSELTSGTVLVEVGARSEQEREYKFRKVEDAINATRHAMEEGIVKGGGVELLEIAKELPKDNILKEIITKPNEQILENNGGQKVPKDVIDPTKVVKTALKTAVSVAGTLLSTNASVSIKRDNLSKEIKKIIK